MEWKCHNSADISFIKKSQFITQTPNDINLAFFQLIHFQTSCCSGHLEYSFHSRLSFSFTKTQKNSRRVRNYENIFHYTDSFFRNFPSPHVQSNLICVTKSPMNVSLELGHFYMEYFLSHKRSFTKKNSLG